MLSSPRRVGEGELRRANGEVDHRSAYSVFYGERMAGKTFGSKPKRDAYQAVSGHGWKLDTAT